MEYGQIFHVTRIGKYYYKNMKYRINIYILCGRSKKKKDVHLAYRINKIACTSDIFLTISCP